MFIVRHSLIIRLLQHPPEMTQTSTGRHEKRGKQKTAQSSSSSQQGFNQKQRDSNFEMSPLTFICSDMFRDTDDKGLMQKTC